MAEVDELLKCFWHRNRTRTGTDEPRLPRGVSSYLSIDPADTPGAIRRRWRNSACMHPGKLDSDGLLDLALAR